ncbi:MAG: LLM class flavin-dependent oxidoreductase [Nitriliruptor sp.]|nr:MAG: LLM class flavin-dependent oxidoreductase [Nitriliruptor sp.]
MTSPAPVDRPDLLPWSILDLAPVHRGETTAVALAGTVDLAQRAEALGYRRVWYAEHHNIPRIASAATSVLIAHVAAHTSTIRLGAGGIMLPNHAPLTIAEQFGTLATLHPGRIDLGLGRAPGTDQRTLRALRRSPAAAERFPDDVLELQGYLAGRSLVPGVEAVPGAGSCVPITILGSSLFGARLAAQLGLPYAFASHFAPAALHPAVEAYRSGFQPSAACERPYVIAGMNVIAAPTEEEAQELLRGAARSRARLVFGGPGRPLTDEEADVLLDSPSGSPAWEMLRCRAVGTPEEARQRLGRFAAAAEVDEVMIASIAPERAAALRTIELLAGAARAAKDRVPEAL